MLDKYNLPEYEIDWRAYQRAEKRAEYHSYPDGWKIRLINKTVDNEVARYYYIVYTEE